MKLRDLFVPRWQHSDFNVRMEAVSRMRDVTLLKKIAKNDEDPVVRGAAMVLYNELAGKQVSVME